MAIINGMLANTLSYYLPDNSLFSCWLQWLIFPLHFNCRIFIASG